MRKEYDFSKGKRGKFYHPDMKLNIPVYLDEKVSVFVDKIVDRKIGLIPNRKIKLPPFRRKYYLLQGGDKRRKGRVFYE